MCCKIPFTESFSLKIFPSSQPIKVLPDPTGERTWIGRLESLEAKIVLINCS